MMSRARLPDGGLAAVLFLIALSAGGRDVSVTLLHTADLQGHVLSLRYRALDEHRGGMLRLASLIEAVREEAEHTVLVDCGGLVSGSVESALTGGLLPLSALARMGYDLRLPSPDEGHGDGAGLDPAGIAGSVPYLCANDAPSWRIIECGGVRFGFAGAMDDGASLRDSLSALRREAPDLLVLLYRARGDDARDRARDICRRFPDFDLVLLGGSREVIRSETVGSTRLCAAGARGLWLGRVDVTFDTVADVVTDVRTDVVEVSAQVEESPGLRAALGANLGRVRHELEQVVGYTERDIGSDQKWPGQSDMTGLVADSVMDRQELVLLAREPGGVLSRGEIEVRDILRAVPDMGSWAQIRIRPPELRRILEENLALLPTRRFLGAAGFTYQAAPRALPGQRIRGLELAGGEKPHGRARLTLRFPAYLVEDPALADERAVLREIAGRPESRFARPGIDTRIRVIKYIRKHSPVTVRPSRTLTVLPDAT